MDLAPHWARWLAGRAGVCLIPVPYLNGIDSASTRGDYVFPEIVVKDSEGTGILITTASMSDAGGFTYSFSVPSQATPGKASVQAYPYQIDWCDDTGLNNRLSGADISFVRASCAERIEPLTITN